MLRTPIFNRETSNNAKNVLSILAIIFLALFSLILTISPAVKFRSWNVDYLWSHWIGFSIWLIGFLWFKHFAELQLDKRNSLIIPITGLLTGWGILSIWRISFFFGFRQSLWFLVCVVVSSYLFKFSDVINNVKKYKYILLTFGLSLAALTFLFGTYPGGVGPKLWLGFQGIYFQPSELLKLLLIFYLSAYFAGVRIKQLSFINSIIPVALLFLSALFLLVAQRDLGTALIFMAVFVFMLFIKYGKKRILLFGFLFLTIAAVIGYLTIDLVRIRFLAWVLPWLDARAGSYQIIQSIIAIAAGGLSGTGMGLGSPRAIPIPHSDFIYSAIVEETGLFGGFGIILIYALLFSRGIKIAIRSSNQYYQFLAAGIVIYLTAQSILIIGGNIRLLPITGVTLPFLSYGGSSLLISFISVCTLLIIEAEESKLSPDYNQDFKAYKILYLLFFSGLFLLVLVTSWWSIARSRDLQLRSDNPRHFIAAQYVKRGAILDRNDHKLADSSGEIGSFSRFINFVPLSNTIGFSNSTYGNAGLEATLDDYLSGERGYPSFDLWFNHLLYDQPPPGRDVRLSIDLETQKLVDNLIGNHHGSSVVLNAETGEILAISSHPYYNANEIESNWDQWRDDEDSPLLNRAIQGAYPIGNMILPFLLTQSDFNENGNARLMEFFLNYRLDDCAVDEREIINWQIAIRSGCDLALINVAKEIGDEGFHAVTNLFSLNGSQDIGLPANEKQELSADISWYELVYGKNLLRANPLQIAISASSISADGFSPSASIVSAVNVADEGWVTVSKSERKRIITDEDSAVLNQFLLSSTISGWEVTAKAGDQNGVYTWYLAGTPDAWSGTPIVVVLVLERDNPEFVRLIGREIYKQVTK